MAPASQYYWALVGWTGSRHFNRSLRLYAQRRYRLHLTSHCLYDPATVSVPRYLFVCFYARGFVCLPRVGSGAV